MAYLVFGRQAGKRQMEKNHEESGVTDGCFRACYEKKGTKSELFFDNR